ncbi:MAG: hypothetical protein R3B51_01800 [Thermodesulfobacteriota bacterium]
MRKIEFSRTPSTPAIMGMLNSLRAVPLSESLHQSPQEVRQKSDISDDEEEIYPGEYDQRTDAFLSAAVYDIHERAFGERELKREDPAQPAGLTSSSV